MTDPLIARIDRALAPLGWFVVKAVWLGLCALSALDSWLSLILSWVEGDGSPWAFAAPLGIPLVFGLLLAATVGLLWRTGHGLAEAWRPAGRAPPPRWTRVTLWLATLATLASALLPA